jgi:hypothetical protein
MKTNFIVFFLLVIGICSCNESSENAIDPQPNLTFERTGMPQIILENVGGQVAGSNYEAGTTESLQIIATNNSDDITVTIDLVDNNSNIQEIQSGNTFAIDNAQSNNVYATLSILENMTTYRATSGTVSISFYGLQSPNSNIIIISGSFEVSDGTNPAKGTFSDIKLICSECGG